MAKRKPEEVKIPDRSLTAFEGSEVIASSMSIPGAAGGLREPLQLDPVELHNEQRVFVVMELAVDEVRFPKIKNTLARNRHHVMRVERATFVDGELVKDHLDEMASRIREAQEAEAGVIPLFDKNGQPTGDDGEDGEDDEAEDG